MLSYYIKMAFRNQRNNKFFTLVNLLEMVVAITTALLLFNYVTFEFSYDNAHKKRDRIYRVESQFYENGELTDNWATSAFGYGSAMMRDIKGIENCVRIGMQTPEQTVSYNGQKSLENGIGYVEPSFFDVFDFKMKEGDVHGQLEKPNTVIISQSVAKRIFSKEEPIGKVLTFAKGTTFVNCEVTGVMEDFPENSHLHLHYLISYATLPDWIKDFWYVHEAYTYLLLEPGITPESIEEQFPAMSEKYKTDAILKHKTWSIELAPLTSIHLNPMKQYEHETKGNKQSLIILLIGACIILIIAWVNYLNLTTARAVERAKDISMRQMVGGSVKQLIAQSFVELFLFIVQALALSIILYFIAQPLSNTLFGKYIPNVLFQSYWIVLFLGAVSLGILLSGLYPTIGMTGIKPSLMLKGNFAHHKTSGALRKSLVVVQYASAVILICGTLIIYKQVLFMRQQKLGADISQTLVLKYPVAREDVDKKVALFANHLQEKPYANSVTISGAVPGMEVAFYASNKLLNTASSEHKLYEMLTVDENFTKTFNLQLIAGKDFEKRADESVKQVMVNEAALSNMDLTNANDAIGKQLLLEGDQEPSTIIGVIKNWHQRGLSSAYTPILFLKNGHIDWIPPRFVSVKINGNNYGEIIKDIETQWNAYFPDADFNYFFLDAFFDNQYKADVSLGKLLLYFTILAFLTALLGLWALTYYVLSKKVKEIGVRKIHGASVLQIIWIFSKETFGLILAAIGIAIPICVWIMNRWLQTYAFRIHIGADVFIFGALLTVSIALISVSWQSWRAARRNPVEALRYE